MPNEINIIGIHDGHNATVALFRNGRVEFALSEERLSRKKNQGGFPCLALECILTQAHLSLSDIGQIAFCSKGEHNIEWYEPNAILERYKRFSEEVQRPSQLLILLRNFKKFIRGGLSVGPQEKDPQARRFAYLLERSYPREKIKALDHHLCHAASAYFGQADLTDEVLCLTNDGGGDGLCATVNLCKNGRIQRLAAVDVRNSYAGLYARATFLLGMMPLEHEYKLMGLAPYAHPKKGQELADKLLSYFEWSEQEPMKWKFKDDFVSTSHFAVQLKKIFGMSRFDVIALGMQLFVEEMTLRWVKNCIAHTKVKKLALAGGLFMNVKLNKRILELPEVESVFIMPSPGDESTPFGACFYTAIEQGFPVGGLKPLKDLYLGPSYTQDDIERSLKDFHFHHKVKIQGSPDLEEAVAELLCKQEVVAFYQGREEFGARALGNRSILADPSNAENIKVINRMIKNRDFWMPFAGTMTREQAEINLKNPKRHFAPYMIMAFDPQANIADFKAATHPYDETIRPQVLERDWNPVYYKVLQRFSQRSKKKGGLLNTSFNLHGYPIVSSPKDALEVFDKSGLKFLALGPFLIAKE